MTVQAYAIVATSAGTVDGVAVLAGQVVNRVLWDGVTPWSPPAGTEARADPDGTLQIGQIATV